MVYCMSDMNHYSFYLYLASAYNKVQECIYTGRVSCCCKKWLFQHPLLPVPDLNSAVFTRYNRANLDRYLLCADLTLIKNYTVPQTISPSAAFTLLNHIWAPNFQLHNNFAGLTSQTIVLHKHKLWHIVGILRFKISVTYFITTLSFRQKFCKKKCSVFYSQHVVINFLKFV